MNSYIGRALAVALASLTLPAVVAAAGTVPPFGLRVIGTYEIPTGTLFNGTEFGGISGLDRAADGSYFAISDDRGGERGTPRYYRLDIDYDASGIHGVSILSESNMLRPDGTAFPANQRTVDPEGIRLAPNGNLYWSSEGNFSANPANRFQPFVREMTATGTFVREFTVPSMFAYVDNTSSGARANKSFEALTVDPDGTLWVANEDALIQDGPITSLVNGSRVRVMAIDPLTGQAVRQYAYGLPEIPLDAIPGAPFGPDNGLPELLALGDDSFLAVERAFAFGVGNTIRLVYSEVGGATDTLALASIAGDGLTLMSRDVLLELGPVFDGTANDNIEAIAWGDILANGNRTLLLAADNNFSSTQRTLFVALEVTPVPVPAALPLLGVALASLGIWRGRKAAVAS